MRWHTGLSLLKKQILILSIFLAVIVITAVSANWAINRLSDNTQVIASQILPKLNLLLEADRDMHQVLVAERTLVFLPNDATNYKDVIEAHKENQQQAIERMHKAADFAKGNKSQEQLFEQFFRAIKPWQDASNQVPYLASKDQSNAKTLSLSDANSKFSKARDAIDQLTELVQIEAEAAEQHAQQTQQRSLTTIWLVAFIGALAGLTFSYGINKLVINTIVQIRDGIEDIAQGEGDLSQRIEVSGNDEVAQLARAFNLFIETQAGIIEKIQHAVTTLLRELSESASLIAQTLDASTNQQAENDQVAAAVTQMAASIQEVARNASDAATATRQADDNVEQGRAIVGETVAGIEALAADIEHSAAVIQRVEEGSKEIGTVMDVISSIAEQTNLLALNAAIEAARAGEQGRGFAVVADEVRTLAQRTQESTSSIRDIIERLQSESSQAVSAMSESQSRAGSVVEHAGKTGRVLESITESVKAVADMNAQIATAAEQQSSTADQISENVIRIKHMAEDTGTNASQVVEKNQRVTQHVDAISQEVSRFKL